MIPTTPLAVERDLQRTALRGRYVAEVSRQPPVFLVGFEVKYEGRFQLTEDSVERKLEILNDGSDLNRTRRVDDPQVGSGDEMPLIVLRHSRGLNEGQRFRAGGSLDAQNLFLRLDAQLFAPSLLLVCQSKCASR